jgi:hypothetical protein
MPPTSAVPHRLLTRSVDGKTRSELIVETKSDQMFDVQTDMY